MKHSTPPINHVSSSFPSPIQPPPSAPLPPPSASPIQPPPSAPFPPPASPIQKDAPLQPIFSAPSPQESTQLVCKSPISPSEHKSDRDDNSKDDNNNNSLNNHQLSAGSNTSTSNSNNSNTNNNNNNTSYTSNNDNNTYTTATNHNNNFSSIDDNHNNFLLFPLTNISLSSSSSSNVYVSQVQSPLSPINSNYATGSNMTWPTDTRYFKASNYRQTRVVYAPTSFHAAAKFVISLLITIYCSHSALQQYCYSQVSQEVGHLDEFTFDQSQQQFETTNYIVSAFLETAAQSQVPNSADLTTTQSSEQSENNLILGSLSIETASQTYSSQVVQSISFRINK